MVTVPKFWAKKAQQKQQDFKKSKYCSRFTHMQIKNHAKKITLVEIDCFDIFHLTLYILLKMIWGCEDGSKKNDTKNINQTFASTFLTAPTEMCLLKAKTAKGTQKRKLFAENSTLSALGLPRLWSGSHAGTADGQQRMKRLGGILGNSAELPWNWGSQISAGFETSEEHEKQPDDPLGEQKEVWRIGCWKRLANLHPWSYNKFSRTRLWGMLSNFFLLRLGHCWYPSEPSSSLF